MKVYPSKQFQKSFKKLPKDIQQIAIKKDKIFRSNPYSPQLKTIIASMVNEQQFDRGRFAKDLGIKADEAESLVFGLPFDIRMLAQENPFVTDGPVRLLLLS